MKTSVVPSNLPTAAVGIPSDPIALQRYFNSLPADEKKAWLLSHVSGPIKFGLILHVMAEPECSLRDLARNVLNKTPVELCQLDIQGVGQLFFNAGLTFSREELTEVTARRMKEGVIEQMYYNCPSFPFIDHFSSWHLVHDAEGVVSFAKIRDNSELIEDRYDYSIEIRQLDEDQICPRGSVNFIFRYSIPGAFWILSKKQRIVRDKASAMPAICPMLEQSSSISVAKVAENVLKIASAVEAKTFQGRLKEFQAPDAKKMKKGAVVALPTGFARIELRNNTSFDWRTLFGVKDAGFFNRGRWGKQLFVELVVQQRLAFSLPEFKWIMTQILEKKLVGAGSSWGGWAFYVYDEKNVMYKIKILVNGDHTIRVFDVLPPIVEVGSIEEIADSTWVDNLLIRLDVPGVSWDISPSEFRGFPEAYVLRNIAEGVKRRMPFYKYEDQKR